MPAARIRSYQTGSRGGSHWRLDRQVDGRLHRARAVAQRWRPRGRRRSACPWSSPCGGRRRAAPPRWRPRPAAPGSCARSCGRRRATGRSRRTGRRCGGRHSGCRSAARWSPARRRRAAPRSSSRARRPTSAGRRSAAGAGSRSRRPATPSRLSGCQAARARHAGPNGDCAALPVWIGTISVWPAMVIALWSDGPAPPRRPSAPAPASASRRPSDCSSVISVRARSAEGGVGIGRVWFMEVLPGRCGLVGAASGRLVAQDQLQQLRPGVVADASPSSACA